MMSQSETLTPFRKYPRWFWTVLILILLLRLAMMAYSPLFDITETRYASIAQFMVLTRDWVTPQIPTGHGLTLEPFLGKPPLSFWLVASAYRFWGCTEWTARLPNFLEGIFTLGFTVLLGRRLFPTRRAGFLAAVILASCLTFFVEAGTVSMDMLVCMTVTGGLWAFVEIQQAQRFKLGFELLLGLFLGLGMLNKGPISLVLGLGPLVVLSFLKLPLTRPSATLSHKGEREFKGSPNWLWVFLSAFCIAVPWFWAAQKANSDFLHYFFVQENFYRFIKPNYGDRYGSGHHQPYGMSWVFTLAGFMPWSLLWVGLGVTHRKALGELFWRPAQALDRLRAVPEPILFLGVWALFAPLFFTFAKSIVFTYFSVSLPPLALLAAVWMTRQNPSKRLWKGVCSAALLLPVAAAVWAVFLAPHWQGIRSMKNTVAQLALVMPGYHALNSECLGRAVPYSWYFYTLTPLVNRSNGALLPATSPNSVWVIVGTPDLLRFRQKYPHLLAPQHQLVHNNQYYLYVSSPIRDKAPF